MSGRKKFESFKSSIVALSLVFRVFPRSFKGVIYRLSFMFGGAFGSLLRYAINKSVFNQLGNACYFGSYTIIKNGMTIKIGDRFSFHEFSYIDGVGGIDIGNDVSIANSCSIISFEHGWGQPFTPIKYNTVTYNPVSIGDDVWVGAGVRILSGTRIESRVIVAAGAVVKGRLESGWIYAGVPAKKVKRI
jgi:acetyltransferase-like isoleucine patch superfamily enzyme